MSKALSVDGTSPGFSEASEFGVTSLFTSDALRRVLPPHAH
jgi:hypothetical protein